MVNNCLSAVFGVFFVLTALAGPASAQEPEAILGGKLRVCDACHGASGLPGMTTVPIIWGLQENYVLKQLREFQSGERKNEVMKSIATALTQHELGPAAAYFAKKDWPAKPAT